MAPLSRNQLEERLTAAGKSIVHPPKSNDELLLLLDRVEELLSKVEQSPPKSMQTVLIPLMKGLVANELLKHYNIDVKVGVASCINEITRITAPDAPYDDDKMKVVFQLIVSSFKDLSEVSSRSYVKRATILETVAKLRSCVIMLDLECDQMIVDMFQHFLKAIRAYHPETIFGSMVKIMTLVIEESEEISTDLLAPLLSTLKRNNKDATRIARTLSERVIRNSAKKLRPYIKQAVTSLETSLDDYSEVLAFVCQKNSDTVGNSIESIAKNQPVVEGKCSTASPAPDPVTQASEDDGKGINFQHKDAATVRSPNTVASNGIKEIGTNEIMIAANTSSCDAQKPLKLEAKAEQFQQEAENHDAPSEDERISPTEVKPVEAKTTLDKEDDKSVKTVTEACKPVKSLTEASPAQSGSHPVECLSETKIKEKSEKLVDEEMVSVDNAPKKASEEEFISKAKKQRRPRKKRPSYSIDKDKTLTEEVASKNDDGCASGSEAKSPDLAEKLKDAYNKTEHESSVRKEDGKKSGHGKATFEKDPPNSRKKEHGNDAFPSRKSQLKSAKHAVQEETPSSTNKKQTPGKEKASEIRELDFGKNLVGSKVKVWWPKDRTFYEGVIDSFDSVKKKHKVLYNDGDQEILNLKTEKWEFIEDDVVSNGDQDVEHSSHDTTSDVKVKRKGNMTSETTRKRQKVESSPKSKQKDSATKSGVKSMEDGKAESESKENYSKPRKKFVDKFKDQSQKIGGKGQVDSAKASGRSKEDAGKNSSQSKQGSLRTSKLKSKTPTGGKALSSYGTPTTKSGSSMDKEIGWMEEKTPKSGSSKVKETELMEETTPDAGKSSETAKGKVRDASKSRQSETKVGKKRRK